MKRFIALAFFALILTIGISIFSPLAKIELPPQAALH